MRTLSTIPARRPALPMAPRRGTHRRLGVAAEGGVGDRPIFPSLIDAKAASNILGVPYTWVLAQAREGRIPHHRLGHYVRFNPKDLHQWLEDTRIQPTPRY
jgi:excisionase family DNA binding protein